MSNPREAGDAVDVMDDATRVLHVSIAEGLYEDEQQ
jgi:hypothetical protein